MKSRRLSSLCFSSLLLCSLVAPALAAVGGIKPDTLPQGRVGDWYSVQLYWESPPQSPYLIVWSVVSGNLPSGVTLDQATGLLSGTARQGGTYGFRVRASRVITLAIPPVTTEKDYTIFISGLGIHPNSLPTAIEEANYDTDVYVVGGTAPYMWNLTALPSGLRWGYTDVTHKDRIKIVGTPTVGSSGDYLITATVHDSTGDSISRIYILLVREPPWDYSVKITDLSGARVLDSAPYLSTMYLDALIMKPTNPEFDPSSGLRFIWEHSFEIRVHRTSGRGNKDVRLFLLIPETTPPGVQIEMSSPWTGQVGDNDFTARITTKVDTWYLESRESFASNDIPRDLTVRVAGIRNESYRLWIRLEGLKVDIYWDYCQPVQVLESTPGFTVDLVAGKSTLFKAKVWIMCSRVPRVDPSFEVSLDLSLSQWEWDLPDASTGTQAVSYFRLNFSTTEFTRRLGDLWTNPVSRTFYLPKVDSFTESDGHCPYPQSVPRPRAVGTVGYGLRVDPRSEVHEYDEYDNGLNGTGSVKRTTGLKLLFVPWTDNPDEQGVALWHGWWGAVPPYSSSAYGDYFYNGSGLWGEWTPDVCVWFPCTMYDYSNVTSTFDILAREMVEYVQGTYPIAETELQYSVVPITAMGDPYYRIDLLMSDNHNWILGQVARKARIWGYDVGVAMRVAGTGGQSRGTKWAVFVDVFAHPSTLAHELYHLLGPMDYDDYTGYPADIGYWVDRDQPRGEWESYFMAGFGVGVPNTLIGGTNDSSRTVPPYFYYWGLSTHWIQLQMYERLINGWFNPERSRDPEAVLVSGAIFRNGSAYLEPCIVQNAYVDLRPGSVGDYYIVLLDERGMVLDRFGLNVSYVVLGDPRTNQTDTSYFNYFVETTNRTKSIELVDKIGRVLAERKVSPNAPTLSLIYPSRGERLSTLRNQTTWITWEASDLDGDTLYYYVAISPDNGTTWVPLATDFTTNKVGFVPMSLKPGDQYLVCVKVSDGFNTRTVISKPFSMGPYVELKVLSDIGGVNGSGWYLKGENATVSVSFTRKNMDGILGLMGGYHEFEGWEGDLTSEATTVRITMSRDMTVRAVFKADYTMPVAVVAVLLAVLAVGGYLAAKLRKKAPPLTPS